MKNEKKEIYIGFNWFGLKLKYPVKTKEKAEKALVMLKRMNGFVLLY